MAVLPKYGPRIDRLGWIFASVVMMRRRWKYPTRNRLLAKVNGRRRVDEAHRKIVAIEK